jgi:hypothetical protein
MNTLQQNKKLPNYYKIQDSLFEFDENHNPSNDSIHKEFMRLVKLRDEWEDVWRSTTNPSEKSDAHREFIICLDWFKKFLNTFDEDILFNKK